MRFTDDLLYVQLEDGREIGVPRGVVSSAERGHAGATGELATARPWRRPALAGRRRGLAGRRPAIHMNPSLVGRQSVRRCYP